MVPLPYPKTKAHAMVDLYPIWTYTKPVQLWGSMDMLTSPSILSIQPSKGHRSLVCKNLVHSEGGRSGVVPLSYPKAHDRVDLHSLWIYTKSMQLWEEMYVLTSP